MPYESVEVSGLRFHACLEASSTSVIKCIFQKKRENCFFNFLPVENGFGKLTECSHILEHV